MAKLIAICGKICSGKTYLANQLRQQENAVILSTDEATFDLVSNVQGDFYDQLCIRINDYLLKKAVEFVQTGCNVILDWGFWKKSDRQRINDYCAGKGVCVEWHYIDISDALWERSIAHRNDLIQRGEGGSAFFMDEGLKEKLLSMWEAPDESEIQIWHTRQ